LERGAGPRRGLRAIFLATRARQLEGALDVYAADVEQLAVPALAARGGDVPALLAHVWLHELGSRRRVEELGAAALAALTTAPWPRNLDSLREAAPRLLALIEHGTIRAAAAALGLTRQALASALGRLGVVGP
jgi:DNA-binding NtrC family response regulator